MQYWLIKSEPTVFSFEDLLAAPGRTAAWDGVRNYQARNSLRDGMHAGDGVLYYHSSCEPTGVVGIAEVAGPAEPDPTQFDPRDEHFDPKSKRAAPTWVQVPIRARKKLARVVELTEIKANPALARMLLVQRGSRLSVQPVTREEWAEVLRMGASKAAK